MKDETWTGSERGKEIMDQYYWFTERCEIKEVPAAILAVGCGIASVLHDFDHQIQLGSRDIVEALSSVTEKETL